MFLEIGAELYFMQILRSLKNRWFTVYSIRVFTSRGGGVIHENFSEIDFLIVSDRGK